LRQPLRVVSFSFFIMVCDSCARLLAQVEHGGDSLLVLPVGDQPQHLHLTWRKLSSAGVGGLDSKSPF